MKGVILAAGKGTRLSELRLQHKSFAVVQKKHIIDYSLDLLSSEHNGKHIVDEIIIVVGYHADSIIKYVGDFYNNVPVKYVYQNELKGIAHAMLIAKDYINDDCIMFLADEILMNPRIHNMLEFFYSEKLDCVCGIVVDDTDFSMKPISYELNNQYISSVVEKPKKYVNDMRGIGECVFHQSALDLLEELTPNKIRGELEMGDWIQLIINKGGKVKAFELADGYINVNFAKDIDVANTLLSSVK